MGMLDSDDYCSIVLEMQCLAWVEGIDKIMAIYELDVLIVFIGVLAWKIDYVNGDYYILGSFFFVVWAGYFNISVFMGFIEGLLIGLFFYGIVWSELVLIGLVYDFEQVWGVWWVLELQYFELFLLLLFLLK